MSNEAIHPSEFQGPRPLTPKDRLAQEFPIDTFDARLLIGELFPRTYAQGLRNWTLLSKPDLTQMNNKEYTLQARTYSWNPHIVKFVDRWMVAINRTAGTLGIDALRLGLKKTVKFDNIYLLPYIHFNFKGLKEVPPGYEGIEKYGVEGAELILLHNWQLNAIQSIVDTVE
jgi:hypothetical protein